jgi:hypothetical protein
VFAVGVLHALESSSTVQIFIVVHSAGMFAISPRKMQQLIRDGCMIEIF